jgi:endonuclease YncB( thermonuclease family)
MIPLLALTLAAGQPFTCAVVQVHDGDTLRCADGTRVRLQGIDANELNGSCHVTCAPRSAIEARDNLARLALGKTVRVEPTGKSYNRVTAWLSSGGRDLSCAQIQGGYAVRWAKFDRGGRLLACFPGKGAK